jgi:hypothetical protein
MPWSMMVQVDRLNWNRTGTLVLASKGDLVNGNYSISRRLLIQRVEQMGRYLSYALAAIPARRPRIFTAVV